MPYDAVPVGPRPGMGGTQGRERPQMDFPSTKYPEIDMPNAVTMQRASSPSRPTLPRRSEPRSWRATTRERYPLTASLTGPGRAGKQGTLLGASGGRYEGEVLAGRPHGRGRYYVRKPGAPDGWALQFEGDWIQGRREGSGTRHYPNDESYTGDWVSNLRHGTGRYEYSNGDLYVGQWADDKRHGAGTLYMASGDIFMGNFLSDRREGMGTLFMMGRHRKYVAEYVADSPRCGTVLAIEDADLAPLKGHLASLALARKLDAAAAGEAIRALPPLQLQQPSKVLAAQVVAVRRGRQQGGSKALRAAQASSGTLSERDIEMLRHSYTLMAAGDGPDVGLLPHQLRELVVMAGLDPAAPATRALVAELTLRKSPGTGRISFDSFMLVVAHFRDEAVSAAAEAAVEAAAAQATATLRSTGAGAQPGTGLAHLLAGAAAAHGGRTVYGDGGMGGDEEEEGGDAGVAAEYSAAVPEDEGSEVVFGAGPEGQEGQEAEGSYAGQAEEGAGEGDGGGYGGQQPEASYSGEGQGQGEGQEEGEPVDEEVAAVVAQASGVPAASEGAAEEEFTPVPGPEGEYAEEGEAEGGYPAEGQGEGYEEGQAAEGGGAEGAGGELVGNGSYAAGGEGEGEEQAPTEGQGELQQEGSQAQ